MKCSIVITTYNNRGLLRQLLRGLNKFPPQNSHEIIVIDNASTDETERMVREQFPSCVYKRLEKNKGLAFANNLGMRDSKGEYVLLLNPDIAIFEGTIDRLIAFGDEHPKAGILGPQLLHPDKTIQFSAFAFPKWYTPILRRTPLGRLPSAKKYLKAYLLKSWNHQTSKQVDWLLGAAMLIRKSALNQVGLQDESFFLYFEDVDLCRRFKEQGFEIWYVNSVQFVHYHRRESAENPGFNGLFNPITKIHIKSWLHYLKKYHGKPSVSL